MPFYRLVGLHDMACLLVALSLMAAPAFATAAEFPTMEVETVGGTVLELPGAFADGPAVIVIAYDQNQQAQADGWVPFLDELVTERPARRYYIIPILPAGLSIVRGMVEDMVRDTTNDPLQRDRTIVLFADVERLQAQLGVSGASAVHVIVLDDAGQVVTTAAGAFSAIKGIGIEQALAALEAGEIGDTTGAEQSIETLEKLR